MNSQFNELSDVTKAAIRLYHALSIQYGKDKTAEAFTAINSVLGHSWSSEMLRVFMERGSMQGIEILGSNAPLIAAMAPPHPLGLPNGTSVFIEMIKEIRAAFGLGLGETKHMADKVREGQDIQIFWKEDAVDVQTKSAHLMKRFKELGIEAFLL